MPEPKSTYRPAFILRTDGTFIDADEDAVVEPEDGQADAKSDEP
jgi:uncharacterized protein YegL